MNQTPLQTSSTDKDVHATFLVDVAVKPKRLAHPVAAPDHSDLWFMEQESAPGLPELIKFASGHDAARSPIGITAEIAVTLWTASDCEDPVAKRRRRRGLVEPE